MKRETVVPKDRQEWLRLRSLNLNSTEISALFNVNPYLTRAELWQRMRNNYIVETEETAAMKWGKRLQNAIAYGVAEDRGWNIRGMDEYISIPELRIGSSFDFEKLSGEILEVKVVNYGTFKDEWIDNDDETKIEATPYIELQVQHQMLVSGMDTAYICAYVGGGYRIPVLERKADLAVHNAIIAKAQEFWKSVVDNKPPKFEYERDLELIKTLFPAQSGKVLDMKGDAALSLLIERHEELGATKREAEEKQKGIKAQILEIAQGAEKILYDGGSISCGMVSVKEKVSPAYTYRNCRIFSRAARLA